MRAEDESVMPVNEDDDLQVLDEESMISNRKANAATKTNGRNLIDREPEKEPEFHKSSRGARADKNKQDLPPLDEADADIDDEGNQQYNLSNDGSLIISESNESILEMKKMTSIPILKNQEQFKNKISKENQ